MKYFNYVLSLGLLIFCMYLLITSQSDFDVVVSFTVMMIGTIFFLFALLEERKEEIEHLRQIILKHRGV
jgi:hypothetical protein